MPIVRALSIIAVALASAACAILPEALDDRAAQAMPGQIEPIHAAAITRDIAVFWVSSNGCTSKTDLTPIVETHGDASVITLRRLAEDRCKTPLDEGFEVQWSFQELGLKPGTTVSVNNPYQLPQT